MEDNNIEPRFEGSDLVVESEGGETAYDARFLISVLLVYVAKGDGEIASTETDRMIDIISRRFDASGAEAMGLLTDAVRMFTDGGNLIDQLRGIAGGLSEAERSEIFGMLLEVITADGELADGEIRTVEFAGKLLGLSQDAIHSGIRAARH
jgi:uncharacterized tellurite resistance protein B-like protein